MKKTKSLIALGLAITLAVPTFISTDASAAEKAPKLSPANGASIIKGETKTFKIKNVSASNVKSLKVKLYNTNVATLDSKKKTSFVVKGVGGGLSDMDVKLTLKKKQAGKTTYKFEGLTIASGIADVPSVRLEDTISEGVLTAMVLKAGSKVDFDNVDNELFLDIANRDDIGGRNIFVHWFEDNEEKYEWSRDAAGGLNQRPETESVVINEPTTGPAAGITNPPTLPNVPMQMNPATIGLIEEHYYQAVVSNTLSHKTALSNRKLVRIVPQFFIDYALKSFDEFAKKYPASKSTELLATDEKQMMFCMDFLQYAHGLGVCLGMTSGVIDDMDKRIHAKDANTADLNINVFKPYVEKMKKSGAYLGIKENVINDYFRYLGYIAKMSLTDGDFSISMLDYN